MMWNRDKALRCLSIPSVLYTYCHTFQPSLYNICPLYRFINIVLCNAFEWKTKTSDYVEDNDTSWNKIAAYCVLLTTLSVCACGSELPCNASSVILKDSFHTSYMPCLQGVSSLDCCLSGKVLIGASLKEFLCALLSWLTVFLLGLQSVIPIPSDVEFAFALLKMHCAC